MTSKLKLLTAFFVLSFAMMIGVLPFNIGGAGVMKAEAAAQSNGGLTVTWEGSNNNAVSSDNRNNKLTIRSGGEYTISSTTTTSATVAVETKEDVTINLSGVSISSSSASPIDLSDAGNVTIELEGTNELTFTSGGDNYEYSGITVPKSGKLTITSADGKGSTSGVLNVTVDVTDGENEGSAIGRYNYNEGNSDIIINGGTITATILAYGNSGAAIGSYSVYCDNSVNNITISGGEITATVTATEYNAGAAIGSYSAHCDDIVNTIDISGGTITAESSSDSENAGAAIGNYSLSCDDIENNITISDGEIEATATADYENSGAAIGVYTYDIADECDTNITIKGGKITATATGSDSNSGVAIGAYTYDTAAENDTNIDISGGTIIAETSSSEGHNDGVAIGAYTCDYYSKVLKNNTEINISNATITAKTTAANEAANSGVAIGVYTYGDNEASFENTTNITIDSGTIIAETSGGNNNGSVIGAYTCDNSNDSFVSNTNITINGGTITATAKAIGRGIDHITYSELGVNSGSAIGVYVYGDVHFTSENNITINDGEITAVATATRYNNGSAIGGYTGDADTDESDTNITISGGTIKAYAPSGKAVKQGSGEVYILPVNTALDVEYATDYDRSSENYDPTNVQYMLCAAKTDISDITGRNTYFYCSVVDTIYQISDYISIEESDDSAVDYNVIVSVYGGEDARYLESVMVLEYDTETGTIETHELQYYQKYEGGFNSNDAIVFPVSIEGISGKTIYALVKTYYNYDAENGNNDTVYYLSVDSCEIGGVEA